MSAFQGSTIYRYNESAEEAQALSAVLGICQSSLLSLVFLSFKRIVVESLALTLQEHPTAGSMLPIRRVYNRLGVGETMGIQLDAGQWSID